MLAQGQEWDGAKTSPFFLKDVSIPLLLTRLPSWNEPEGKYLEAALSDTTLSVSSRDSAVTMEMISHEWVVHKLNMNLTSQICVFGKKVKRVTIFPLKRCPGLLATPSSPFPLGRLFHVASGPRKAVCSLSSVVVTRDLCSWHP